jgi:hypothetical protein
MDATGPKEQASGCFVRTNTSQKIGRENKKNRNKLYKEVVSRRLVYELIYIKQFVL